MKDVYWNCGNMRIMITTKWVGDPSGAPAVIEEWFSLMPGEGIDLSTLGLKRKPPGVKRKKKSSRRKKV